MAGAGVRTTIPFLRRVLDDAWFRKGRYSTGLVERLLGGAEVAEEPPAGWPGPPKED